MTITAASFIALETSLSRRLETTMRKVGASLYPKIEKAIAAQDWVGAESLVRGIDLSSVFDLNEKYIVYVSRLAMLFGASRVTPTPGTSLVGLGFETETIGRVIDSFRLGVILNTQENLIAYGLQLIALEMSKVETVLKDADASRKAWVTRRRLNAGLAAAEPSNWTGKIDPDLGLSKADQLTIETALQDLSGQYPSLAKINVTSGDWLDETGGLATKSNTSIYLNKTKINEEGFMEKYAKEWDGAMVDPSLRGIIVHESGHILDGQLREQLGSKKYNAFLDRNLRSDIAQTTPYGMENDMEFMAESFTTHFLKKTPNGVHPSISALITSTAKSIWDEADKLL
jgi:hypothetical protein